MKQLYKTEINFNLNEYRKFKRITDSWIYWLILPLLLWIPIWLSVSYLAIKNYWLFLVCMLVVSVIVVVFIFVCKCISKFRYKRIVGSESIFCEIYFYEENVVQNSSFGKLSADYARLYDIDETKTNYYLYVTKKRAIIILKSNCSEELLSFIAKLSHRHNASGDGMNIKTKRKLTITFIIVFYSVVYIFSAITVVFLGQISRPYRPQYETVSEDYINVVGDVEEI